VDDRQTTHGSQNRGKINPSLCQIFNQLAYAVCPFGLLDKWHKSTIPKDPNFGTLGQLELAKWHVQLRHPNTKFNNQGSTLRVGGWVTHSPILYWPNQDDWTSVNFFWDKFCCFRDIFKFFFGNFSISSVNLTNFSKKRKEKNPIFFTLLKKRSLDWTLMFNQ